MSKDTVTAESFAGAVADHVMTVLQDDGVYRHLHFGKPKTTVKSFSIVTWPGYLAFTGDIGDYIFKRLDDMMEFFRGHAPNPRYWSEICVAAGRDGLTAYDPDCARAQIEAAVVEGCEGLSAEDAAGLRRDVDYDVLSRVNEGEHALREALRDFHENEDAIFPDSWEWNLESHTYPFVWACHAIPWAIAQYDQAKAGGAT